MVRSLQELPSTKRNRTSSFLVCSIRSKALLNHNRQLFSDLVHRCDAGALSTSETGLLQPNCANPEGINGSARFHPDIQKPNLAFSLPESSIGHAVFSTSIPGRNGDPAPGMFPRDVKPFQRHSNYQFDNSGVPASYRVVGLQWQISGKLLSYPNGDATLLLMCVYLPSDLPFA